MVTDPAGALVGLMESHGGDSMPWGESGAVAWVEAQSRDLQASGAFYESLLGWTQGPEADGYRVFQHDGEQVAGLMAVPAEVPPEVPSYWGVLFAVLETSG